MANQSNTDPSASALAGDGASKDPAGLGQQEVSGEQDGKTPATLAELEAHKAEVKALLATQYQGVQSLLDRQSGNLKTALEPVNRLTATLEGMGVELTPAQTEQLRQAEVMHTLTSGGKEKDIDGKAAQPGQAAGEPAPADDQPGVLGKLAMDMMQQRGVVILATDPELELIDQETKDPKVFMDSVELALDTKIKRLAAPDANTGDDAKTDAQSVGPGINPRGKGAKPGNLLPAKTPGGNRTSSQDFLQAGFQESGKFG